MIDNNRLSPVLGDPSNEQDLEIKFEKICPPKEKLLRRRSSFLAEARRRSFEDAFRGDSTSSPQNLREDQMIEYVEALKKEDKSWIDVVKKRKLEYQEIERKYTDFCKNRHSMNEEDGWLYLDEDDRQYLRNLPNFNAIVRKSNQLVELNSLLQDKRQTNKLLLMKVLEKIDDDVEDSKEKIRQHMKKVPL